MEKLDQSLLPNHLGFILDGNRRWAKSRGLASLKGHQKGAENLRLIANEALSLGVKNLSVYLFSTENWQRTKEEVGYLMRLIVKFLDKYVDELVEKEVRLVFVGSRVGLPKYVLDSIDKAVNKTKHFKDKKFAVCINYGGQQEIVDAAKKMLKNKIDPDTLTPKKLSEFLYAPELPPLDLVVRTSGEFRMSGYMLYRAAYAEMMFIDKKWPDFSKQDLRLVLQQFAERQRRFGK